MSSVPTISTTGSILERAARAFPQQPNVASSRALARVDCNAELYGRPRRCMAFMVSLPRQAQRALAPRIGRPVCSR